MKTFSRRYFYTLISLIIIPLTCSADDGPMFLPFDLTLGGVKAKMEDGNALFAMIPEVVKADAELKLEKEVPMLIINAFPCEEDGTVKEAQAAGVLIGQNTSSVKLSETMDKKPLKPGTYLANVVADGKTARIVFTIGEAGEKAEFGKVFNYLKKKAGL